MAATANCTTASGTSPARSRPSSPASPRSAAPPSCSPWTRSTAAVVDQVGAKMANLGEIRNRIGLRVPDGFAITAAAAKHFMESSHVQDEINRRLKTLDIDDLEALYTVSSDHPGSDPRRTPARRLEAVDPRSTTRDSPQRHGGRCPGLAAFERPRGRQPARLLRRPVPDPAGRGRGGRHRRLQGIVASKYQSQAIVYRQQRGYRHQDVLMCVGCLAMVDAVASGVAYSRPPKTRAAPGWSSMPRRAWAAGSWTAAPPTIMHACHARAAARGRASTAWPNRRAGPA